ncbi:hypothetical protein [Enterovibrio calviensis]|uniref:hypothetical protein n=1 Tax=Enterovibrio calviensis TaxID=91359 RepID=UPI0037369079
MRPCSVTSISLLAESHFKGQSPFKPDREHLHHICQRIGLSSCMTLVFICALASFFAGIGMFGEIYEISETIMFIAFLVLFTVY